MVQQNFHFSTQAQYLNLGFVTAQEIQNTTNNKKKQKRNLDSGTFQPQVISFPSIESSFTIVSVVIEKVTLTF